jgi:DNA-binding GntR family transcriptional regulator
MSQKSTVEDRVHSNASLADRAYQSIRDRILRGYYPLGTALSRRQLAKELRMSFLPISQALQHLEIDGLVESKPRVGTRVRVPIREDVLERYGLREALETQAARLCAENADQASRKELMKMGYHLDQLYASIAGGDEDFLYSVHTYHMRFHLRVAEIGGNSLLRRAIEREQVLVFNWLFDRAAQQRSLPWRFHAELAAALTGSTVEAADAAMRTHIRYGMDRILEAMQTWHSENGWRVLRKTSVPNLPAGRSRQPLAVR